MQLPVSCGSNQNEALHRSLKKNISRQRLGIRLALALLGVFFFMWNEKKETYFPKSAIVKNVQEYFHSSLKMGKSLCTEAFRVEPDVKPCNSWNEEDIPTSIHCLPTGQSMDSCSSSDEELYTDSDTAITNEEVIQAIKSAKLKHCVAKELAPRAKTEMHSIVNSLSATKSVLLLLSNSS